MIPIASETLLAEMTSIKAIVDKWVEKVSAGVPGEDSVPTGMVPEQSLDVWITELVGELRLLSGKTENIAQVISSLYD